MKLLLTCWYICICINIFAQQTIELCPDEQTTFTYTTFANEPGTYIWTVNSETYYDNEITVSWNSEGTYNISVIFNSTSGCLDSSKFTVNVIKCSKTLIFVPNVFTPDNDGLNDYLELGLYNVKFLDFYVFNRWGEQLFHTNSLNTFWDGYYLNSLCKQDIYVYSVKWIDLQNKEFYQRGRFTLLR